MKVQFKQFGNGGGGAGTWVTTLAASLQRVGVETEITYYPLKYPWFPLPLIPTLIDAKVRAVREGTAGDILHTNTHACAVSDGTPTVMTVLHVANTPDYAPYAGPRDKVDNLLAAVYERLSASRADEIVCISESTRRDFKATYGIDATVIYPGVNPDVFRPMDLDKQAFLNAHHIEGTPTILFFSGNLTRRKGAHLLPLIMDELGDDYLLLTTSGLSQDARFRQRNILSQGQVSLDALVAAYNLCDIFLFPSRLEGFGLSVAEAMACGKPVVTTNASSLPELVCEGKGGYLCERDNVPEFADRVTALAGDAGLRAKMGDYNRRRVVDAFSPLREAWEYCKIYERIYKNV